MRPKLRRPGVQIALAISLGALLLAGVPAVKWLELHGAASRLLAADLAYALSAPDVAEYRGLLRAASDATGASSSTVAAKTLVVAAYLKETSDRRVTSLSVLDAVIATSETSGQQQGDSAVAEVFRATAERLQEMYAREEGTPPGAPVPVVTDHS
jgi:hypothetical protein